MNLESQIKNLAGELQAEKETELAVFSDTSITATAIDKGIEDAFEDGESAIASLMNSVGAAAASLNPDEEGNVGEGVEELNPAQIRSAEMISPLVLDSTTAIKRLYGQDRKLDAGTEDVLVDNWRYGVDDSIDMGIEYFDMQNVSTSLTFNVVYNTFAPRQDEFAELMFPLVAVDPVKAGARITARIIKIYKEYMQTIDGVPAGKKIDETPLIKAVTDIKILTNDKVKLVPVYRADKNDNIFFNLVKWQEEFMDETVTTAPIKFGVKTSIVGLAQTDGMLAKGGADFTDGIETAVKMQEVFVRMTGKDADGNDVTETFKFSLKNRNSWFNETIQGNNKQMVLNFEEDNFFMLTPTTPAIDENGNEVESVIMQNLPANLEVNLEVALTGNVQVALGDVRASLDAVTIKEIKTAAGVKLAETSDDYQSVQAVIDTTVPGGYVIDTYATLGNAKRKGIHLLSKKVSAVVTLPYRSGFTEILPTVVTGDDGDPTDLVGQIMGTRLKLNAYAIKTMIDFIDDLRANPKAPIQGISKYFVDNSFTEFELDLATIADSIRSTERTEDVKAALVNKIKLTITKMVLESNYKIARETLGYSGPIDVLIGMGLNVKMAIFGDLKQEMVGGFRFNYAGTPFEEFADKIVITVGVRNGNTGKDIDPLNFGVCLWSPELVINTKKTIGEGVRTEISTFPRFIHYINLPILSVINLSNVSTIADKNVYRTLEG